MKSNRFNEINGRIIDEIIAGRDAIQFQKEVLEKENDWKDCYNKVIGNLTASTFRKYISNIINYHGLDLKVSNVNAFIEGCPIEWDLIVLKKDAYDVNDTNVFKLDDCVCLFEFKTSGLMKSQLNDIDKTFDKQFKHLYNFREKCNGKKIPFAYVTFSESHNYYEKTKEYFDKMNNLDNTTFVFVDYDLLKKNIKSPFEECNDFEMYLNNLFKIEKR